MSSQFAKVMVPPVVDAPRGAQWAAAVAVWIGRLASGRLGAGAFAEGGSSDPWHRGHHTRCLSRTFQRVPHDEQTWITRPA